MKKFAKWIGEIWQEYFIPCSKITAVKIFLWILWDFSGLHFIWLKIKPPKNQAEDYPKRPTFFLWFLSIYIATFGLIEAKHERDINRAFFERNDLMVRLNTGNAAVFVAAMKDFGRVQTLEIIKEPELFKPWRWWTKTKPNLSIMHGWAQSFLGQCQSQQCSLDEEIRIDLNWANLSGANLSKTNLSGAKLLRANLSGADLSWAYLSGADLSWAYLSWANLSGADLGRANLGRADLSRAYLGGSKLNGSKLNGANLNGANLSGANLSGAIGIPEWVKAGINENEIYSQELLIDAIAKGFKKLEGSNLFSADLSGADLSGANLSRANLSNANLSGANLFSADLSGANLFSARYSSNTKFPINFNPKEYDMILVED